jgi:hypothetical protein
VTQHKIQRDNLHLKTEKRIYNGKFFKEKLQGGHGQEELCPKLSQSEEIIKAIPASDK